MCYIFAEKKGTHVFFRREIMGYGQFSECKLVNSKLLSATTPVFSIVMQKNDFFFDRKHIKTV